MRLETRDCVQKMNQRSVHPHIASTYTSSGTFLLQGYLHPTRRHSPDALRSKKIQVFLIFR